MEDNQIKELFNAFEPELGATSPFMARLQRNMKAVEWVKQHQQDLKRRNRVAVAIAACCGFAMGVIFTLLFPVIDSWGPRSATRFPVSSPYLFRLTIA
jgi:tetrahydromethanopterin S-methyltransferase subunit F